MSEQAQPVGGFIGDQIASAILAFAGPRNTQANMRGYIDALIDSIDRDALAAKLVSANAQLLDNQHKATATGEDEDDPRPAGRRLIKMQARIECRKAHPDWTRQQCRAKVDQELTDARIVEAIQQAALQGHGVVTVEGIADWWQWLLDNWKTVLPIVVSILLAFL